MIFVFVISEFRATLALRAEDNEILQYREISKIFYELAESTKTQYIAEDNEANDGRTDTKEDGVSSSNKKKKYEQKVWSLDLEVKIRTSKKYIEVLDVESPEDYSVRKGDVNMLTFCRSLGFSSLNHEQNVISAVCSNKLDIAHALTEDEGVPIVVEITEGIQLLSSYMEFHRYYDGQSLIDYDEDKLRTNLGVVDQYHKLNKKRHQQNMNVEFIGICWDLMTQQI